MGCHAGLRGVRTGLMGLAGAQLGGDDHKMTLILATHNFQKMGLQGCNQEGVMHMQAGLGQGSWGGGGPRAPQNTNMALQGCNQEGSCTRNKGCNRAPGVGVSPGGGCVHSKTLSMTWQCRGAIWRTFWGCTR